VGSITGGFSFINDLFRCSSSFLLQHSLSTSDHHLYRTCSRTSGLHLGSSITAVEHSMIRSPGQFPKDSRAPVQPYSPLAVNILGSTQRLQKKSVPEMVGKNHDDTVCVPLPRPFGCTDRSFPLDSMLNNSFVHSILNNSPAPFGHKPTPLTLAVQTSPSSPDFSPASFVSTLNADRPLLTDYSISSYTLLMNIPYLSRSKTGSPGKDQGNLFLLTVLLWC
jgi:hypothetical protein